MKYSILALVIAAGSSPALADEAQSKKIEPATLYFETDSAAVDEGQADAELKKLARWAKCHRSASIILEGHADPRGSTEYNADLSARRAVAVRENLLEMGVKPEQIVLAVFGETNAQNKPFAEDRRVTARLAADDEMKVLEGG